MKIHLENAIFVNRAPFDRLELNFNENGIAVLTAVNGKGKTTILSHIVDAFYEMARPNFPQEFEGKEHKLYRVSSPVYNLDQQLFSCVYLRFKTPSGFADYVDIRNKCTKKDYDDAVKVQNKIQFNELQRLLNESNFVKKCSFEKKAVKEIFSNNILTYFPSYRYECPGYLNDPYKIKLNFTKQSGYSGYLDNPIEVVSGLPQLANWILDIVLDGLLGAKNDSVWEKLNHIITLTLVSKKAGNLRFGIGPRNDGLKRIQIMNTKNDFQIYPTIFNMSSGESAILCLFGELLRQADNYRRDIELEKITGIVLIDEIDKHLHIRLQKEVLPKLLNLFPNVQFIVSSHSPFLSMGLAEEASERSKIIDLDNFGISTDPTTNDLYKEVYDMMIGENDRFKEMFHSLEQTIQNGVKPLIITEGKTDAQHLKKAKERLNIEGCDIEFHEINEDWGDSKLRTLLEQISKIPQSRKIIGIFDRDVPSIVRDIEKDGAAFKNYGNNVYGFCIPVPAGRENYTNISIEFYYSDNEIKKEKDGKRLYFDNEIDFLYNKSTNQPVVQKLENPRTEKENLKKIFHEERMCEVANWIHSKATFANLVETDSQFIQGFDFSRFSVIFYKIKTILAFQEQ